MTARLPKFLALAAALLAGISLSEAATVITSNSGTSLTIGTPATPGSFGSNISLPAPGSADFTTSAGLDGTVGTPDLALSWTSRNASETQDWRLRAWNVNNMSEGGALQIRGTSVGSAFTVSFTPPFNAAVVINGFNFIGDRDNPGQPYQYRVDVVDASTGAVAKSVTTPQWETNITQTPAATGTWAGAPAVDVSFTGDYGKAYRLELVRLVGPLPGAPSTRSEVDMAIDNLSFDQLTGFVWTGADGNYTVGSNWNRGTVPATDAPVWINSGIARVTTADQIFTRDSTTRIDGGTLDFTNTRVVLQGDLELRSGSFVQNNSTYFIARGNATTDTRFLQTGGTVNLGLTRGLFLSDLSTSSAASGIVELRGGSFLATLSGNNATLHQVHIGFRANQDLLLVDGGSLRITHNGNTDDRFVRIGRNATLRVASGTAELLRFHRIVVGHNFGSNGTTASLVVDGGSLTAEVSDALLVGDGNSGRLEVHGGQLAIRKVSGRGGDLRVRTASANTTARLIHSGGELTVEGAILLGGNSSGPATFEMSGGVLRAASLNSAGSPGASFIHTGGEIFLEGNQVALLQQAAWFVKPPNAVMSFDATTNTTRILPDFRSEIPAEGIPYQAYLTGPDGLPIGASQSGASAPVNIDFLFQIFDAPTGGTPLHAETQTLAVDRGAFGAILGSGQPVASQPFASSMASLFPATGGDSRFVQTSWRASSAGDWTPVLPRVRMLGAPYALHAVSTLSILNPDGDQLFESSENGLAFSGNILSTGTVSLSGFTGNGSAIRNLDASAISSGTMSADRLSLTAGHFNSGTLPVQSLPDLSDRITRLDASKFTTGLLPAARLPAGLATLSAANSFTQRMTFQTNATLPLNAGPAALADQALRLATSDQSFTHGWLQYRNSVGSSITDLDGPALSARFKGILGSRSNGQHKIALEWNSSGIVQINGRLTVDGGSADAFPALSKGRRYTTNITTYSSKPSDLKVFVNNRIQAFAFGASSDARAKNILAPRDPQKDADLLRKLRVVDYTPVDAQTRKKGFIAQEVRAVFPEAVTLQSKVIPDILAPAHAKSASEGLLRLELEKPHGLRVGDIVGIDLDESLGEHEVVRIDSPVAFSIKAPAQPPLKILVVGRRVDDFHILDYDRLFLSGLHVTRDLLRQTQSRRQLLDEADRRLEILESPASLETLAAAREALANSRDRHAASPIDAAPAPVSTQPRR